MRYPAGDNVEVVIEMAGRPHSIWGYVAGGKEHPENAIVVKSCDYVLRTPNLPANDPNGRAYGNYPKPTRFDPDRPGPFTTPDDVVVARLTVSCPVPFNFFAA